MANTYKYVRANVVKSTVIIANIQVTRDNNIVLYIENARIS